MFKINDIVIARTHRSHAVPKGSIGIVVDDSVGCRHPRVEWRCGQVEFVSWAYLKRADPARLSKSQRLWAVKRRLKNAL